MYVDTHFDVRFVYLYLFNLNSTFNYIIFILHNIRSCKAFCLTIIQQNLLLGLLA